MGTEIGKVETVAIARVIKSAAEKVASSEMTAGEHPVDFTVRIKGTIKKGENYEQEIVAKADFVLLFAVALSHLNGATVDSIVRESLTADPNLVDSLKVKAAAAVARIKETTKTHCSGKVTTNLKVELV